MKIVVLKFGGTSMATEYTREAAVARVREALSDNLKPVVVVSAMGRAGDPYATDTLKSVAENIYPHLPLREMDLLMSCGEIIAGVVFAAALHRAGIKAEVFTGLQAGLITDGTYGSARVVKCETGRLRHSLAAEIIPVVAGFQGATESGEINTLGRGGSDITAVILGAALGASHVEIFTDVDGISTADPRLLKEARVISQLTYSEVCQLAYDGAKVIHPAAVEVAMKHNVSVKVRSLTAGGAGTLINMTGAPEPGFGVQPREVVTGIASAADIVQIRVDFDEPDASLEALLFEKMAAAGISIDLISVFPRQKFFTIKEEMLPRAAAVLKGIGVSYYVEENCAKVAVVGLGMRGIPGVMARVVRALQEKGITILQTADSNISIAMLIRREDLETAVKALHDHFILGKVGENYQAG